MKNCPVLLHFCVRSDVYLQKGQFVRVKERKTARKRLLLRKLTMVNHRTELRTPNIMKPDGGEGHSTFR